MDLRAAGTAYDILPLVVLLDGQIWANSVPVAPVLDALLADGRTPPVVAVLVDDLLLTEVPGGHDWAWWRSRIGDGLENLFGP